MVLVRTQNSPRSLCEVIHREPVAMLCNSLRIPSKGKTIAHEIRIASSNVPQIAFLNHYSEVLIKILKASSSVAIAQKIMPPKANDCGRAAKNGTECCSDSAHSNICHSRHASASALLLGPTVTMLFAKAAGS